jgi:short-subunit dehydrogenase
MSETARGIALVTGASSGIGLELSRVFAKGGYDLVLVARSADRLADLADEIRRDHGRDSTIVARDLLVPGAVQDVFAVTRSAGLAVDVLVNNAGLLELGAFAETELGELEAIVELNARVPMSLARLFVQPMIERGRGRILNVASSAAFQPIPSLAVYAASKAFVLSLTESLSEELQGTGVTATALCPGLTATHMTDHAKDTNPRATAFPDFLMADAADVARRGYEACMAGSVIEVPGLTNRVLTDWSRLQPRWVVRTLGGLIGRRFL